MALKEEVKDVFKVSRKTFFNPSGWLGYGMLKAQFVSSWRILKSIFTLPVPTRTETFSEAATRFNLTEEQIQKTASNFFLYSLILTVCGVITIGFSVYLLFHHGTFAGFILGMATTALFFAYAFRFSFWRFQIQQRKLGCTFKEWLSGKANNHEEPRA